ncbi:MAG: sensor histidine kinase [Chitinophagales bacterium]|jgi:LytS/YehU family sensor histidine kinase
MNIYQKKTYWKWYLAAAAVFIVSITLWYTKSLADRLSAREDQQAQQFAEALRNLAKTSMDEGQQGCECDVELHRLVITQNTTVPAVLLDEGWNIIEYRNIGDPSSVLDTSLIRKELGRMAAVWSDTIEVSVPPYFRNYLVYSRSNLLTWLKWYPYIQLLLIGAFISVGYIGFSASRKAQENRVWLGMAKETAHQLGTPITAIMGWIEAIKATNEADATTLEMLDELNKDVLRLELVSDRFSKIGSQPELTPENLYLALERNREYMQRRSPRKVIYHFPNPAQEPAIHVLTNAHLFDWVIENLIRNSIDAMESGVGEIRADVMQDGKYAIIEITDTGKGIPSGKHKTIFKPGYSTKTRGWGLGLSLSKRIVEQYHNGKIAVKRSEPGKGATFSIRLPLASEKG